MKHAIQEYCNAWWGYTKIFGGDGGYTPGRGEGLYKTKIFIMHFYAQNAVPGLYEGRNGRLYKKFFFNFCSQKWGFIPAGYTPGITLWHTIAQTKGWLTNYVILGGGRVDEKSDVHNG